MATKSGLFCKQASLDIELNKTLLLRFILGHDHDDAKILTWQSLTERSSHFSALERAEKDLRQRGNRNKENFLSIRQNLPPQQLTQHLPTRTEDKSPGQKHTPPSCDGSRETYERGADPRRNFRNKMLWIVTQLYAFLFTNDSQCYWRRLTFLVSVFPPISRSVIVSSIVERLPATARARQPLL